MVGFTLGAGGRASSLRRTRRVAVAALAVALTISTVATASAPKPSGPGGSGNTVSNGADPDAPSLTLGAQWWPFSTGPGQLGAIPQAIGVDHLVDGRRTKKVFMTVTRNPDTSNATLHNTMKVAEDNGLEFKDYTVLPDGYNWASSGRRSDGTIMLYKFVPATAPAPNRFALPIAASTDVGRSWTFWNAPIVENKWKLAWYRVTHAMLELQDGTLLQGVYAGVTDGTGYAVVILQSTDKGRTWTQRSRLTSDGDSGELALARASDGRLIAVTRSNEGSGNPTRKMKQTFSADDGLTWEPQQTFVPPPGLPAEGILPEMVLQPNGALVLTYGRPDNNIAVSWDGTGRTWNAGKVVYANYIRDTHRGRSMGSSGNTSVIAGESNYSLNFGDICHNVWSCREHGQQVGNWVRRIDAVTPGTGKVDLATGVADGIMKISGDVVPADARFPEQRLAGAVDGSNEYRAAARLAGSGPKRITIELDRQYPLDRIGLMLDRGTANSADVQLSTDGVNWTSPVVRQRNSVDYALRYHDIAPTAAKYVRISNDGGSAFTALNELELYAADTWTFENDAVNVTPRGTTDTLHAFTADTIFAGEHSRRRAIIVDMDPDSRGTMTFPVAAQPGLRLTYGYAGVGYGSGAIWELLGKDADGKGVTAWKFWFRPVGDGFALSAWDGNAWQAVGTFPTYTPNGEWIPVEINANGTAATMTVHGKTLTTTAKAGAASTLHAFRPSTGINVADQNMEHSFDNVQITPLGDYAVGAASPAEAFVHPATPLQVTVPVRNFTDKGLSLPVSATVPTGWRVDAPASVAVPANGESTVTVTVESAAPGTQDAQLAVKVGDQARTVRLRPTSDWVRSAAMTASSSSSSSSPENLNEGNTDTGKWGAGGAGAWNDNTPRAWPDWVTATWAKPVTLTKAVVYTLDSPTYPASANGVRDYDVQVLAPGGGWQTVAQVRGNAEGVVTSTFPAVQTTALRILISDSNDHNYSRLISIQAFSS